VRLENDYCSISVDSSGALLHRRGYRLATAKAPLRETLAAGMLLVSGWDTASPLLDPFCGSGTIPIEAALLAKKYPARPKSAIRFYELAQFRRHGVERLVARSGGNSPLPSPLIIASDRDAGAIRAAQANAERAGVSEGIEFSRRALSAIEPPACPGWVVTNPPYGTRLTHQKDLRNLYAQMGNVFRARCAGWRLAVLCTRPYFLRNTGLEFEEEVSLMNGGLKVRLFMEGFRRFVTPGQALSSGADLLPDVIAVRKSESQNLMNS